MLNRRNLLTSCLVAPWMLRANEILAQATRGEKPLTIDDVKVFGTSPRPGYSWVFIKVITSEPGLYGLGSANFRYLSWGVKAAIEKHMVPFWKGKPVDRIEDMWQWNHQRSYWRNGPVTNVIQAAMDSALWDIKGKRAGMPVYELLGGKVRDAVPLYAHGGGSSIQECVESVQRWFEQGFRHVRVQMGGYGGLKGVGHDSVGGLRGNKGTVWEGGLRVPGIIEWPAEIKPRITLHPASTMDIFPTLVDLLGLPRDSMLKVVDGMSIKALLAGEIGPRSRPLPFHYHGRAALIDNDLKIVTEKTGSGNYLLFDLKADKTESTDLFTERPQDAKRLQTALDAMIASIAKSRSGEDYSEGRVTREGPHGRFWYAIPEYQPFLKDWAARPEYKNWANRRSRKNSETQK